MKSALESGKLFINAGCYHYYLSREASKRNRFWKGRCLNIPLIIICHLSEIQNVTGHSLFCPATLHRTYLRPNIGRVTQQAYEPGWMLWGLFCSSLPTSSYFISQHQVSFFFNSRYCWLMLGLYSFTLHRSHSQWVGKNVLCHSFRQKEGELEMPLESSLHSYPSH